MNRLRSQLDVSVLDGFPQASFHRTAEALRMVIPPMAVLLQDVLDIPELPLGVHPDPINPLGQAPFGCLPSFLSTLSLSQ